MSREGEAGRDQVTDNREIFSKSHGYRENSESNVATGPRTPVMPLEQGEVTGRKHLKVIMAWDNEA